MTKGPIISIVLVLGIVVLGTTAAILFVLNPASRGEAADQSQRAATSKSDAPILSEKARIALSSLIRAQGFDCPSVSDGTPSGDDQSGQLIRVRCDNDFSFKVTMRSQGAMMFTVAPWQ
jgi:hypothetical protein